MKTLLLSSLALVLLPAGVKGDSEAAPIDKIVHIYFTSLSEEFMKKFATEDGSVPMEKKQQAVDDLIKMTKESQKEVVQAIEGHAKKYHYDSFWVVNMISMNETDTDLLERITNMKGVKSVDILDRPPPGIPEERPGASGGIQTMSEGAQWNIKQLNVPEVWNAGINGSGVVVSTLHNGAFVDHSFIRHNFRGDPLQRGYGFYEPRVDGCAHAHAGIHITTFRVGIAVGKDGYGVAPAAVYMMCSVDNSNGVATQNFLDCVQWTICPHNGGNAMGTDVNCTNAPRAVSVSSVLHLDPTIAVGNIVDSINMMVTMGITVITDAGRIEGDPCRRISPACTAEASICAGFTNKDGKRSKFSACGPGPANSTKPDIVVPGYMVTGPGSCKNECPGQPEEACLYVDDGTTSGSGHVLGVVALMLQKNPKLTPARVKQILIDSSHQVEDEELQCCGDLGQTERPNYCSGYGLLDAKKAVDSS